MAIVFVSPKQRQRVFFVAIISSFALLLLIIALLIFIPKPKAVLEEEVFSKPKIDINFDFLNSEKIKVLEIPIKTQMQFDYEATTENNKQVSGRISAFSKEEAEVLLKRQKLTVEKLQETKFGRENPFVPYYQTQVQTEPTNK